MADLNLSATVADGGGSRSFVNPTNTNDDNGDTYGYVSGFVGGAGTHTARLYSNLGSAAAVAGMVVYGHAGGGDPGWVVQYSSDNVSWSTATSLSSSWNAAAFPPNHTVANPGAATLTFGTATAQHWRLEWDYIIAAGLNYVSGPIVHAWEIGGVSSPAPEDPPEPGVSVGTAAVFTDRAISWRITRGASPEVTGGGQPGRATLIVRNDPDDRFNPENESSPIVSDLRDGTPIWIGVNNDGTLGGSGTVVGLFGGYVTDVTPIAVPGATVAPTVEINAEDALALLARRSVTLEMSRVRSHGGLRQEVLDNANIIRRTLPPEIETMPLSGGDGRAASILDELNNATGTRHFVAAGTSAAAWYSYTARDRQWHLSGTAQATLAGTQHVSPPSGWRRSADTVVNEQRVSFAPVAFTPQNVTVWKADVLPITLSGTATRWIQFDDYVDSPAADLNYTGSTATASVDAYGDTAMLSIVSAGTSTITGLSVEGALARRAPTESYVANNDVSQADPRGIRSGPDISNDYVGTLASARGLAEHIVWRYGDPQVRPTLTVTNWFPYQFDLDLFDLISFSSTQLGVSNRLFEIVGLTHEGRHAGANAIEHVTTYVLQECRVQSETNWFTTDTHAPDGSAITGY